MGAESYRHCNSSYYFPLASIFREEISLREASDKIKKARKYLDEINKVGKHQNKKRKK